MLKFFALFSLVLVAVNAALSIIPYTEKPAKFGCEEGCYIPDFDTVIAADAFSYPSPSCESYYCSSSQGFITFVASCPVYTFDDPTCSLIDGDKSQVYPNCCAYVSCTNPEAAYTAVA